MSTNLRKKSYDLTKPEYLKPQTRLEANKWLDKASFGAATSITNIYASTKTNIVPKAGSVDDAVRLMDIGYEAWVNEQLTNTEDSRIGDQLRATGGGTPWGDQTFGHIMMRYVPWFHALAVYGKSKLRLKATFALSQLFALRQTGATTGAHVEHGDFIQMLYDATLSNNTSSFRKLLKEVSMSQQMGRWLTYLNNTKEDLPTNKQPDQNYAREVTQLFTIGLYHLNMDGTFVLDSEGNPIPTYGPADIPKMAEFWTGFIEQGTPATYSGKMRFSNNPQNHELRAKFLFPYLNGTETALPAQQDTFPIDQTGAPDNGYTITAVTTNTFTVNKRQADQFGVTNGTFRYSLTDSPYDYNLTGTITYAGNATTATITRNAHGHTIGTVIYNKHPVEVSIDSFLDHLFNHPTCPPFIAKSLIKFFVTSNPTPQYVRRVAEKFVDNGNGVRGDLSAVIKAILLDREAIIPLGINPNNHGRHITILERTLKLANAFRDEIVHYNHNADIVNNPRIYSEPRDINEYYSCSMPYFFGQMQFMNTPSVFNFYRPGYVPPATILGNLGLTGPELQIHNQEAATVWANMVIAATDYIGFASGGANTNGAYGIIKSNVEGALDPRGNFGHIRGLDFTPHSGGWTVTDKPSSTSLTITGTQVDPVDSSFTIRTSWRNRRTGTLHGLMQNGEGVITLTTGVGSKTYTITSVGTGTVTNTNIGDVLDMAHAAFLGHSGFPTCYAITGGGQPMDVVFQPYIPLYYKAANTLPNTSGTPSEAQVNVAIDYLEGILMTRPISAELRAMMMQAAQAPVTLPANYFPTSDVATQNHYFNLRFDWNQVRIRRMIALVLISPEFSIQY